MPPVPNESQLGERVRAQFFTGDPERSPYSRKRAIRGVLTVGTRLLSPHRELE